MTPHHDPLRDVPEIIARGEIKIFTIFPDQDATSFAYTVGMTDRGRPELVMAGLPVDLMGSLIFALSKKPEPLIDGAEITDIASCPVTLRMFAATSQACAPLILARRYYGRLMPVCQIVCPDPDGLYPWDRGCDRHYAFLQAHFGDLSRRPAAIDPPRRD